MTQPTPHVLAAAQHLAGLTHYWAHESIAPDTTEWRVSGVIFSALVMIDGGSQVEPFQLAPGRAGDTSLAPALAQAFAAHFPDHPGIQAFRSGPERSGFGPQDAPATAAQAAAHLIERLRGSYAFFLHADLSLHERLVGAAYALTALLAGQVTGEPRWTLLPPDAEAPALNLNAYELHDLWSRPPGGRA